MTRSSFSLLLLMSIPFGLGCQDDKKAAMTVFKGEPAAGGAGEAEEAVVQEIADRPQSKGPADAANSPRKIIQMAKVAMTVENVEQCNLRIMEIVKDAKGYVVKSDEVVSAGDRRKVTWTIRVPIGKFDTALNSFIQLGEVTRRNTDSKDVTEDFYDTEARLKHWKSEEETLLKLMKEKAISAEDVLKFRVQITDVREKIERMEAHLKTLKTLTDMATIDLEIRDRDPQAPAIKSSKPTTSVGRTFAASCDAIVDFGHGTLIFGAGIAPWLPIILVVVVGLRFGIKRMRGSKPPKIAGER